jgi:hypothetical protein
MIRSLLMGVLVALSLSTPALAGKLATTHLYVPAPGSLACHVSNVSTRTIKVGISIVFASGIATLATEVTLAPGASSGVSDGAQGNYHGRCHFTFEGPKSDLRAASVLFLSNSAPPIVLPAD